MEKIPHNNVCWMRFHTVYGSTVREDMFLDKLKKGTLEYTTNHERDFIHIDDICDAINILLDSYYTGPVDIGTGVTTKISSICPNLPVKTDTPYERLRTCADMQIMSSLGFEPKRIFPSSQSIP
jgi:nucleoside-diphosphate-sugar epimerase